MENEQTSNKGQTFISIVLSFMALYMNGFIEKSRFNNGYSLNEFGKDIDGAHKYADGFVEEICAWGAEFLATLVLVYAIVSIIDLIFDIMQFRKIVLNITTISLLLCTMYFIFEDFTDNIGIMYWVLDAALFLGLVSVGDLKKKTP